MSGALYRILSTPLAFDVRGDSVRIVVAADKYTVANISEGMNDREEYARLFAAAPELLGVVQTLLQHIVFDEEGDLDCDEFDAMIARAEAIVTELIGEKS